MRDFPGQPMFLVPDAAIGAQRRTVHGRRVALRCPRLQQRDQMAPQTPDQCGQPRWQFLKRRSQVRRVGNARAPSAVDELLRHEIRLFQKLSKHRP